MRLPVWRIRTRYRSQLRLPLVSIRQQLLLIVQQLLPCLSRILRIRSLHDRINRTAFLAEPAVYAFRHINVVPRGPSRAVCTLLGFNCDGLRGTDGFAEFAGDAPFFPGRIPSKCVFATEAGRDWAFLEGVVDRVSRES